MKCPKCNGKTTVTDTRHPSNDEVLRSRVCNKCQHKFYTSELEIEPTDKFIRYWQRADRHYSAYGEEM